MRAIAGMARFYKWALGVSCSLRGMFRNARQEAGTRPAEGGRFQPPLRFMKRSTCTSPTVNSWRAGLRCKAPRRASRMGSSWIG